MFDKYDEIHVKYDNLSGCTFIVVLNTFEGNKCSGGTRMQQYVCLESALADAVQLTQNMSKKCRIIGKEFNGGFSGGKGVIWGDPSTQKTPEMLMRYGEFVNTLEGRFFTGTDLNINNTDAEYMSVSSPYIDGLDSGIIGDTAIGTAYGIVYSMRKCVKLYRNKDTLAGAVICVQGCGSVGSRLIKLLVEEGVVVYATDCSSDRLMTVVDKYGVLPVKPRDIYDIQCDIFSPNANGGIVSKETIARFECDFIIGSANNQLRIDSDDSACDDRAGCAAVSRISLLDEELQARNIVYLPDYLVNIGGVYTSICEQRKLGRDYMLNTLHIILNRAIDGVFSMGLSEGISLLAACEKTYGMKRE